MKKINVKIYEGRIVYDGRTFISLCIEIKWTNNIPFIMNARVYSKTARLEYRLTGVDL